MRICSACGHTKHESEFSSSTLTADGVSLRCRHCISKNYLQKVEYKGRIVKNETATALFKNDAEVYIDIDEQIAGLKRGLVTTRKIELEAKLRDIESMKNEFVEREAAIKKELIKCRRILGGLNSVKNS